MGVCTLMPYTQEDLDLIEKHVAQGERNVRQQRQIVTGLGKSGYPIGEALQLLASLEGTLYQLRRRHARIHAAVRHKSSQRTARIVVQPLIRPIGRR
jgi:hypothetical protein